jgi:hypothetical protein
MTTLNNCISEDPLLETWLVNRYPERRSVFTDFFLPALWMPEQYL